MKRQKEEEYIFIDAPKNKVKDIVNSWTDKELQLFLKILETTPVNEYSKSIPEDILDFDSCMETSIDDIKKMINRGDDFLEDYCKKCLQGEQK